MAKKRVCIVLGCLAAPLLVASALSPVFALGFLLVASAFLVCVGSLVGWWVPLPAAAVYFGVRALCFGADFFAAGGAVLLALLCVPLALRQKLALLPRIGLGALIAVAALCALLCLWATARGVSPYDVIPDAVARLTRDPLLKGLARRSYRKQDLASLGHAPLLPTDAGYAAECLREYAYAAGRELQGYLVWYLGGYAAFFAGIAMLGGAGITQACGQEDDMSVADVRLGRWYLIIIATCLLIAVLGVIDALLPATRTVMHLFVTLPTALCGITLVLWVVRLVRGKWRILAVSLACIAFAAALVWYEWGLLILGFLGLGDVVLDMRRLLTWALS